MKPRKQASRVQTKRKSRRAPRRTFYIMESETGWDIKRYYLSVHTSQETADKFKAYLDAKDPDDKHEVFKVQEV